ncbi:MAG TPA: hypothetical protein VGO67_18680 [Verrucomicrobiae bacterium]|jgi:hypothetical protein
MTKQQSLLIAAGGALLVASTAARAQSFTYAADDLLLNFRNAASITAADLEVNLGQVSDLTSFQGSKVVVPASLIQSVYGSPSVSMPIGFSATAADASGTTGTIWLTRADSTPGSQPTVASAQQVFSAQNLVAARIANIGTGAAAGTVIASQQSTVPGATTGNSYQAQAEQSSAQEAQSIVNFAGGENIAASKGSNIESVQDGSGTVYEALWKVPVAGTPDTYLGYFTFKPTGEVDFTSPGVVPQPPTLSIVVNGASVSLSWPATGNFTLQQNADITVPGGWTASALTTSTANGTTTVTTSPASGNLFFRLSN